MRTLTEIGDEAYICVQHHRARTGAALSSSLRGVTERRTTPRFGAPVVDARSTPVAASRVKLGGHASPN